MPPQGRLLPSEHFIVPDWIPGKFRKAYLQESILRNSNNNNINYFKSKRIIKRPRRDLILRQEPKKRD